MEPVLQILELIKDYDEELAMHLIECAKKYLDKKENKKWYE